jgi:hypothetical protein
MERTAEWQTLVRSKRPNGSTEPVTRILSKSRRAEGAVTKAARAIMDGIATSHRKLEERQGAYMALHGGISDDERDEIDVGIRCVVSSASEQIQELSQLIKAQGEKEPIDQQAHMKGMILVLLEAHQELSAKFQTFKAFRAERTAANTRQFHAVLSKQARAKSCEPVGAVQGLVADDLELSKEDEELMEMENLALQDELDNELGALLRIEQEMVKVTDMCAFASQKIQEQAAEIEDLYNNVSHAVYDLDQGNVQLQKASEATVSSRIFMLIFLLVASFVLLFLHWYMD